MKPLEPDVKHICIGIVRGHERRTREYRKQYLEILYGGSCPDGQPKGNRTSTPTEDRAGRLMQLEASPEAARIRRHCGFGGAQAAGTGDPAQLFLRAGLSL